MYYFASDVHLGAGGEQWTRHTEQRFVRWLDMAASDADGIFLLGDIFDFWWEYRKVVPKGFVRTFGKLAELTDRGVKIYLITGNHDMWMYDYLQRECGVEICFSPQEVTLSGKQLFLAHGDNMNIKDKPLLRLMNTTFRSRSARKIFSWLVHPDWALRFGHWWSGSSRKRHAREDALTEALTEPLIQYARTYAEAHPQEVDHYLFGHMHYARNFSDEGLHVVLLGAWDCFPSYAVLDDAGNFQLKQLDL